MERERQRDAGRMMTDDEDDDYQEEVEEQAEPKIPIAPPINRVVVPEINGELIMADKTSAGLVTQAMELLAQAASKREESFKRQCVSALDELAESVHGYQNAVTQLIEHGAALELRISALRKLLEA